jgi:hypothetical protein
VHVVLLYVIILQLYRLHRRSGVVTSGEFEGSLGGGHGDGGCSKRNVGIHDPQLERPPTSIRELQQERAPARRRRQAEEVGRGAIGPGRIEGVDND